MTRSDSSRSTVATTASRRPSDGSQEAQATTSSSPARLGAIHTADTFDVPASQAPHAPPRVQFRTRLSGATGGAGVISIKAGNGPRWDADDPTERLVMSVDLRDSTRRRLRTIPQPGAPRDLPRESSTYCDGFLRHNALVYELFERLPHKHEATIVDFVADGVLLTFRIGAIEGLLEFAIELVNTLREHDLETGVGVDVGPVALFELFDSGGRRTQFVEATGVPVDRAIRLSWLASSCQILVAAQAFDVSLPNETLAFTDEIPVTLDKWGDGAQGVKVRAVYANTADAHDRPLPANERKAAAYLLWLRAEMDKRAFQARPLWDAHVRILEGVAPHPKRDAAEYLVGLLNGVEDLTKDAPPEVDHSKDLATAIETLQKWCEERRAYLSQAIDKHEWDEPAWTDPTPIDEVMVDVVHGADACLRGFT